MKNKTGLCVAAFASCLMHGIFIFLSDGLHMPPLFREKRPIEIEIIRIPETVSVSEEAKIETKKADIPLIASLPPAAGASLENLSMVQKKPEETLPKYGTVFLLDASESMVVSLEEAKQILLGNLERIGQKEPVNIVFFSDEVNFFSPKPVLLVEEEKENAISFCKKITPRGSLAIESGLEKVVRTGPLKIVLISDGLTEDKERTYEVIRNARKKGITIDTVLVKHKPFDEEMLKKAAYLTGGTFSTAIPQPAFLK